MSSPSPPPPFISAFAILGTAAVCSVLTLVRASCRNLVDALWMVGFGLSGTNTNIYCIQFNRGEFLHGLESTLILIVSVLMVLTQNICSQGSVQSVFFMCHPCLWIAHKDVDVYKDDQSVICILWFTLTLITSGVAD